MIDSHAMLTKCTWYGSFLSNHLQNKYFFFHIEKDITKESLVKQEQCVVRNSDTR